MTSKQAETAWARVKQAIERETATLDDEGFVYVAEQAGQMLVRLGIEKSKQAPTKEDA